MCLHARLHVHSLEARACLHVQLLRQSPASASTRGGSAVRYCLTLAQVQQIFPFDLRMDSNVLKVCSPCCNETAVAT